MLAGLALGLGLPGRLPGEPTTAEASYWCMRVLNYPPLSDSPSRDGGGSSPVQGGAARQGEIDRSVQLSCGEHTDYGMLTLVNQQLGVTALQACDHP